MGEMKDWIIQQGEAGVDPTLGEYMREKLEYMPGDPIKNLQKAVEQLQGETDSLFELVSRLQNRFEIVVADVHALKAEKKIPEAEVEPTVEAGQIWYPKGKASREYYVVIKVEDFKTFPRVTIVREHNMMEQLSILKATFVKEFVFAHKPDVIRCPVKVEIE